MNSLNGLVVLGFGGHARSVADVALSLGIKQLIFVDENAKPDEKFCAFPVTADFDFILQDGWAVLPASGDNAKRESQIAWLEQRGLAVATLISHHATIGIGANVGEGCFVGHHAHIGPMADVGKGSIVNTGAVVEHECVIGEFSHISVNAVVAGRSRIGIRGFIGAGATVIDGMELAADITIGAGGCANRSLKASGVYVGVPAKKLEAPK